MSEIMAPLHHRWNEFCERLEGPEGCNFREDVEGHVAWDCDGTADRPFARKILEDMGGFDVEETMLFFNDYGGYCDCEILFNVR